MQVEVAPSEALGGVPAPKVIAGRYEVLGVMGRGGMGAVYRVRDRYNDRPYALKQLTRGGAHAEQARALFEREFCTLASLRHPRIIEVHDYGRDERGPFFTMELLEGADMRDVSPLPWHTACHYLREVATSLALLHVRRLVHRDVTPRNVRMTPDGHCKLFDFGALADTGQSGSMIGTPPCIPPEALDGKPIDARLDLYALGCLGYFMLTGKHAFPATDTRQLRTFWARELVLPSAAKPAVREDGAELPAIPPELDALIASLMQLDAMARPSSAGAVIDRLEVILGESARDDVGLAASYLGSAPLTGREPQLLRLRQALEQTQRGRGLSMLITGPTGMGRSRLLLEIGTAAKLQGVRTVRANAEEHARPYGTVQALIVALLEQCPEAAQAVATAQAPVLAYFFPQLAPARSSLAPKLDDAMHWRSLCQSGFRDFFVGLSRVQPLALLVDDVHRADESSALILAGLAHEAKNIPLLLVCTQREEDAAVADGAVAALTHSSQVLRCAALSQRNLQRWLESVFGDAPNLQRLSLFLHERTAGQPALVTELLRFLIEQRELRYREGTWALPTEPSQLRLPERAEQAFIDRLTRLDTSTRALAEALSIHRGALSFTLCRALDEQAEAEPELRARLDALIKADVLLPATEGYRFTSQRLRELLSEGLSPERRPGLHRRVADAVLAADALTAPELLGAGLHLLQANDDRGADLVVSAALSLARTQTDVGASVRLVEAALALFHERDENDARKLLLLGVLGQAAYMVDRRLAKYENELADTFDRVLGMERARRWASRFGKNVGALLGLGFAACRYWLRPKAERPCGFAEMMQVGVSALTSLAGTAAICLDGPAIQRIVSRIRPLAALGREHAGGYAYAYCVGLHMVTEDRFAKTYACFLQLEATLKKPGVMPTVAPASLRVFEGGVNYVLGVFESFRSDAHALERADALERSGNPVHELIAEQLRLQYYGFRGEAEEVRKAYESMEACAIQTGYSWQVETWSAIATNLYATLWEDVIIAKRSLDETARMAREVPSLQRYATTSDATYNILRGKPRESIQLYAALLPAEPPLSRIGWSVSYGLLAQAHNQVGEHDKAKEICERVLATVDPADAPYAAMRIYVETALVNALAALGQGDAARKLIAELLQRYAPSGNPLVLGTVHEAAAEIALAAGDRKTFLVHLKEVEAHFTKLGNPALIARFQRLSDIAGEGGGMGAKVAIMREVKAFDAAMSSVAELELGARHMLAWLMDKCEGLEGYLLVRAEGEPRLVAATSIKEPPSEVFDTVAQALRSFGSEDDTTNMGTQVATQTGRDGNASHLYLLSYLEGDRYCAEGALVLLGRSSRAAPPVRFELLHAAAKQLCRLRATTNTTPPTEHQEAAGE